MTQEENFRDDDRNGFAFSTVAQQAIKKNCEMSPAILVEQR